MIPTEFALKELNRSLKHVENYPHFIGERNVTIREGSARMIRNAMLERDKEIELLQEKVRLLENQNNM